MFLLLAQRQGLKYSRRASGHITLIGDKALPAARDGVEVHVRKSNVAILTPETAVTVGV